MSEQEKKELETTDETVEAAAEASVKAAEQTAAKDQKAVAAKKSDKPAAKKKPGFFARIGKWFHELVVEGKKVVWPTRKQVVNNTLVVIFCIVVVCIMVTILDVTFGAIRDFIARLV
jgi:preprotein translocase subunit SecE